MAEISLEQLQAAHDRLVATLREWKDEVKELAVDYNTDLKTVQATINRLDATEKRFWNVYKPYIITIGGIIGGLALIFVVIFGLIMSGRFCGKFDFPSYLGSGSYTGKAC